MFRKLLLTALSISVLANAASLFEGMSKEQLGEYEITITHKPSGKVVGRMSRADYMVVKVGEASKPTLEAPKSGEEKPTYSVILSGGVGKDGLKTSTKGNLTTVEPKTSPVGQVMFCRTQDDIGLCVHGTSNSTVGVGVKFDIK
jgi:hypothetical protein